MIYIEDTSKYPYVATDNKEHFDIVRNVYKDLSFRYYGKTDDDEESDEKKLREVGIFCIDVDFLDEFKNITSVIPTKTVKSTSQLLYNTPYAPMAERWLNHLEDIGVEVYKES